MKHLRSVVPVFMILLGLAASSRAQDPSAQYLQAGNTFYSQKSYDQAIRYYQAAAQMNANSWQAYQGLGGCYYAKGDNSNALVNYQKSLDINPNNPQVSQFVQYLKSQSTAPPLPSGDNGETASGGSSGGEANPGSKPGKKFEFDVDLGLMAYGGQVGFGGGVGGFFFLGKSFAIGALADFYTVSQSASASGDGISENASASVDFLDFAAAAKFRFGKGKVKPYVFAGFGVSDVIQSASGSSSDAGGSSSGSASTSAIDPMLLAGGGVQFQAGPSMDIFVQIKEEVVIVPGTSETVDTGEGTETVTSDVGTANYTALEGGLGF